MKWLSLAICVVAYLFCTRAVSASIRRLGRSKEVAEVRIKYLEKTSRILLFVAFVIVLCLTLGFGYGQVSLFLSSAFAVIGVALFAQWSILSNITASMVIFFGFPYRVGDEIKVTDADFDLSGTVEEISLFHVLIRTAEGNLITYPNNLILQKPVIKLDRGNTDFPQKVAPRHPE
ncbi:mechanosensitive ion channel [Parahaliea maris]|uniref:Small-conductance mechanosensitive channel n=1 Tax=Parahaliea maris TaxID=2716870 RepID=A0A5C9A2T9_9GAMM|nr:mechanosensitive ion channel domain-containing protein [Parahaliea maris]TXS95193.1 mechanosensitive ion channel [Parahaliea maris]